jgi:metal-responsive CopG/Arc/MetJ family transcriptional regulator
MTATIQVVLEEELLKSADKAARRLKLNRSALIRNALREHLKRLRTLERERLDRQGYDKFPDGEFAVWDGVTAWPEE